jgi:hypothetical protein
MKLDSTLPFTPTHRAGPPVLPGLSHRIYVAFQLYGTVWWFKMDVNG